MTVIRVDKKMWLFIWWDGQKRLNQSSKQGLDATVDIGFNKTQVF